jgi:carbamoyl-phosphate synthase small subunit
MVSTRVQQRAVLLDTGDPMAPHTVALHPWQASDASASNETPWVGVVDFGVKRSILRHLLLQGLQVRVFPHDVRPDVLLSSGLRGVLLSNGPGDPARMDAAVEMIRGLLGQLPLMGICLGHQLLGRALGGETWKLRFGHRGPNQPVLDEASRRVQITAQNHGFAVRLATGGGAVQSHRNLNDQTCEGLRVESMRILSVQHHPEAAPGPHDATVEFANFARWLQTAA